MRTITGELVPTPTDSKPYAVLITLAGRIVARVGVPSVIAGEAMIRHVVGDGTRSRGALRY